MAKRDRRIYSISRKKMLLASIFLGFVGGDRMIIGEFWLGILKLLANLVSFGLWYALDIVFLHRYVVDEGLEIRQKTDKLAEETLNEHELRAYKYLVDYTEDEEATKVYKTVKGKSAECLERVYSVPVYKPKTLILLSALVGGVGVDRFYIGDIKGGVLKLILNFFTLNIWYLYDIVFLSEKAKKSAYVRLSAEIKAYDKLSGEQIKAYEYAKSYCNGEDYDKLIHALTDLSDGEAKKIYDVKVYSPVKMILISYFLGECGVDRFYVGDVKGGLLKLFLGVFTLGLWYLFDLFNANYNTRRLNYYNLVWPIHRRLGE